MSCTTYMYLKYMSFIFTFTESHGPYRLGTPLDTHCLYTPAGLRWNAAYQHDLLLYMCNAVIFINSVVCTCTFTFTHTVAFTCRWYCRNSPPFNHVSNPIERSTETAGFATWALTCEWDISHDLPGVAYYHVGVPPLISMTVVFYLWGEECSTLHWWYCTCWNEKCYMYVWE